MNPNFITFEHFKQINYPTLNEAFSSAKMEKVFSLIGSYLERNLGITLYEDPYIEEFQKNDGTSGYGKRYYGSDFTSIRLNIEKGASSTEISSIDIWENGSGETPDYTIETDGVSVVKFLPDVVARIKEPAKYMELAMAESKSINEGRGRKPVDLNAVYKLAAQGKTVEEIVAKTGLSLFLVKKGIKGTVLPSEAEKENETKVNDDVLMFNNLMEDLQGLVQGLVKKSITSILVTGRAGTGKTFSITKTLKESGLKEGSDYVMITGTVSNFGLYKSLYDYNDKVLVFDDADAVFADSEGRNILKGALDSKEVRKISWLKKSGAVYDSRIKEEDPEKAMELEAEGKVPNQFDFTGQVIFVSNMSKDKADPDGAIRSRSILVDINPSNLTLLGRIEMLLPQLGPEGMSLSDKKEIFEYVKKSNNISMRTFDKAARIKMSGHPNWKRVLEYSN